MQLPAGNGASVFLLKGITGSGKTEIYLKALAEVVARGKKGICLVPEIALTPQTIQRFLARFPGRVAVFHSGLTPGEQYDEWKRIAAGECDVVIGPRSALFVPQKDIGLIVIDEEHEWTYKQTDQQPHYHTREAAIKLAELVGAMLIMGSATPDVETYYRAGHGRFYLLELEERITVRGISPLPEVEVVDLRQELKEGNRSLFSRSLKYDIEQALTNHQQIILFLNRRGSSTLVQCKNCGYVFSCPHCLTALTYHSISSKLVCHHCRYSRKHPDICPQCHGDKIRYFGVGTQKVEEESRNLFPEARILRWDSDATTGKRQYEEIMNTFQSHRADILVGTQIIAKGLDIPDVSVVGVINADTGLNIPDFRAGERTFQLACQVAGRAGRGLAKGKVVIQTYNPDNYAIRAAANQDYMEFYNHELDTADSRVSPVLPAGTAGLTHSSDAVCRRETDKMVELLNQRRCGRAL
jgi:primosomal protein N' (replication factor Y)